MWLSHVYMLPIQITHDASSPSSTGESPTAAASRKAASLEGCGARSPPTLTASSSGNTARSMVRPWSQDGVRGGEDSGSP